MDEFGGYDLGGYDPNMTTWDPASAYYQPSSGWTSDNYISPVDVPYGGGLYSTGGEDWSSIYAPPENSPYPSSPTGSPSYSPAPSYQPTPAYQPGGMSGLPSFNMGPQPSGGMQPMGGSSSRGGSSMGGGVTGLSGKPEDDLYQKYKGLLMNPDFSSDPTYKFLYNQGLQSLNRNLAAKRLTLSGKSMNDTMDYGAGMTAKYMQDLLPQYRGGAQEELARFMGPAGLSLQASRLQQPSSSGGSSSTGGYPVGGMPLGGNWDASGFSSPTGSGLGWGGVSQQPQGAQQPAASGGFAPRPLSNDNYGGGGDFNPYYDGYDIEGGPAYG